MLIFLCGFMGCGKSTAAPLLAKALKLPWISSDLQIELKEGKSIPEIFKSRGEAYFRKLETDFLKDIECGVVDTGGGLPCIPGNLERMQELGVTVFLNASVEQILKRLSENDSRPLLQGDGRREKVMTLLDQRMPFYKSCLFEVNADKDSHQVVEEILEKLKGY